MRTTPITVRLPDKILNKVQECAKNKKTSLADWTRQAILAALHDKDEDLRIHQVEARLVQRMGDLEQRLMKEIQSLVSE